MNFEYFERLSHAEAAEYLHQYLNEERRSLLQLRSDAVTDGVHADLTIDSVPAMFVWLAKRLRTIPQAPDPSLPSWIRNTESYATNLFTFDEPSKILILRASFYLGESFVRESPLLSWSSGRPNTAEQNMPVVTGFLHKVQLAPLLVAENLFGELVVGASIERVRQVVKAWYAKIPHEPESNGAGV